MLADPQTAVPVLRPYQRAGCSWLVSKLTREDQHAVLLCDDPGLGKTLQTLKASRALGARRRLIVGPAGARNVWMREIPRWHPDEADRLLVVEPGTSLATARHHLDRADATLVISFDLLSQRQGVWTGLLRRYEYDLLVIDEAHFLKNASKRTEALYGERGSDGGIQSHCDRTILITGTPTPNHAGELYQHVRTFWPSVATVPRFNALHVETQAEFEERYTRYKETPWGRQVMGSKNQEELRYRMGHVVLRRRKQDVLKELPPLVAQDVALDLADVDRDLLHLNEEQRSLARRWASMDDQELEEAVLSQRVGDNLATLRRQLGQMKVLAALQWIEERLACGIRKMLVFGWHVDVLHRLHRLLAAYDPVIITGETSPKGRRAAEDLFQYRPRVRVLVGQMLAAGTALTLTAADEVAILEPSWVPGQNSQAIDRAHRLGQLSSVLASFLYLPGTIDETIMTTFRRKAEEVARIYETQGG